ncbi:ubiquitin carboxyl-terminal hydrolase MINDY-3 homolog [Leptopilina heterotoma]|uniref:ubiquitin carboxyl-terminal hydrolase MINDY-3 homolog n=1 Tax=Leptopilina heterotoma TaxID=63436 RepID=UPI001CA7DEE6|nr:ubiquitin carboxyl-terminal hydrolase MINDY-3 homolog [Leptopilina heterotoma]
MAENAAELLENIKILLWGPSVKEDVFRRWAQGFYFSQDEPSALVQREGGPCVVIAPVQAFIIKQLLQEFDISTWKDIKNEKCDQLLVKAVTEIVAQAADVQNPKYSIVFLSDSNSDMVNGEVPECSSKSEGRIPPVDVPSTSEGQEILSENFHSRLRILPVESIGEVENFFMERINLLKESYGVFILLYTVICTKGMVGMQSEMLDSSECLIESTFGYGSQSLINLMLTGRAVGHVWDHEQDVGGLKLLGIEKQNSVGFLAYLEHLQYCEVGAFLKSPKHPVWVLGSETHLTVLFSPERDLVRPETPAEKAKRIFNKYSPDGNNFIQTTLLQDVLAELNLVNDSEYVDIIKQKLDKENLGIILFNAFMEEFFSEQQPTDPDTFTLYHYNGLSRSNPDNKIIYHKGQVILLESNLKCVSNNSMLTVLQTKWPNLEVEWDNNRQPSLN